MHYKKKKQKQKMKDTFRALCSALIMHLLLEPGDGGLSKFSLLSGRGSVILWQKRNRTKAKNLACLQQQYYMYLEKKNGDLVGFVTK